MSAGKALRYDRLIRFWVPLLFFGCYFVFLLRYIDPAVIYSSNGINIHNYVAAMHAQNNSPKNTSYYEDPPYRHPFILELTPEYLRETAVTPGGWTRFAVTLCIYACHYPFAGAFAVTALALFFFWIFPRYLQGFGTRRPIVLGFVPALFLMILCAWYELKYCAYLLPVAGSLAFAVIYQRFRSTGPLARSLFLSLLFWIAWYFFQWGCLLVLLFAIINHSFCPGRKISSISIATAVNGTILYALDAWFIPLDMTIRWNDFTVLSGLPLAVIGFFPLSAIALAVWSRFRRAPAGEATVKGIIVRISLIACGAIVFTLWLCKDPVNRDTRTFARTIYHVANGQWEAVLHEKTDAMFADFPKKGGALQAFMVHAVDQALCRTGQIGDRLFAFPQKVFAYDPLLMLQNTLTGGHVNWVVVLELAMDLGMVNTAEKIAGEIMENMGPFPDIIYRRTLIQIAKGNREAATVYLSKLSRMPFYRTEAKRLLKMIDNNDTFASEPRIAGMRANMDTTDYFLFTISYDAMLKRLLQSNPGNKMAYDYLMTFCIYNGRFDGLAALAPAAPAFGYTVLPRSWEEALCVTMAANQEQAPSEATFSGIRQETVERFNGFVQTCLPLGNDSIAAAALAPAFGDSYFYFSVFRYTRGVRHE